MGILAIILSLLGKRKATEDPAVGGKGMAIAGLICGILGLVIAILMITLFAAILSSPFWLFSSY